MNKLNRVRRIRTHCVDRIDHAIAMYYYRAWHRADSLMNRLYHDMVG